MKWEVEREDRLKRAEISRKIEERRLALEEKKGKEEAEVKSQDSRGANKRSEEKRVRNWRFTALNSSRMRREA